MARPKKVKQSVSLPVPLMQWIRERAARKGIAVSAEINNLLDLAKMDFEAQERGGGADANERPPASDHRAGSM